MIYRTISGRSSRCYHRARFLIRALWFTSVIAAGVMPFLAFAQDEASSGILDRLERRLLDQERDALSFGSKYQDPKAPAKTSYKYKGTHIDEISPSSQDMQKFDAAITEIEQQVEYLASQVHQIKQKILQDAQINNLVSISTKLGDADKLAFRSLKVKVDGHVVYEQSASLGLWLPDSSIPIFQGPMQPGNHQIEFQARLVEKAKEHIPLQNDTYHQVNETYQFNIPDGKIAKKWQIALNTSSASEYAKAEFKALQ